MRRKAPNRTATRKPPRPQSLTSLERAMLRSATHRTPERIAEADLHPAVREFLRSQEA